MPIYVIGELQQKNNAEFPILDDSNLRGGHRSVQTLGERDSIPEVYRKAGMTVYVVSTETTYQLDLDLYTWNVYNLNDGTPVTTKSFTFNQLTSATVWVIDHNLGKIPNVVVTDSAGYEMYLDVYHPSPNRTILNSRVPVSGKATLT